MNSPRQQEMDKLQKVETQVNSVQQRLDQRLPLQRAHMTAFVCAWKWRLQTLYKQNNNNNISEASGQVYTQELLDSITKKLRMDAGVFEYGTKEQGELLTRCLFQLDDILSHGDPKIKDARKALVVRIQGLLERADLLKVSASKLKQFTERVIGSLPVAPAKEETDEEEEEAMDEELSEAQPTTDDMEVDQQEEDATMETTEAAEEIRPLFDSEEDAEEEDAEDEEENAEEAKGEEEDEEENCDEEQDDLPVWKPYYQLQKRADGVYLLANLHGIDADNLRVQAIPQSGMLRISGVKLPTQKDLILSQLRGTPTFGRFEIVEKFPSHLLDLANATQQMLRDGTLQVRLPYAYVPAPRVVRRRISPFLEPRLVVW